MKKGNKTKLEELLVKYGKDKVTFDKLKKIVDSENASIKSIMAEEDLSKYEHDGWVAKYVVQHRESMDEEHLLTYLEDKCLDICHERAIIKTKKYIDFDALESAIYNEAIDKKLVQGMDKFREIKEVPTLKISKVKE